MPRRKSHHGFTVVELFVASVLVALISLLVMQWLTSESDLWELSMYRTHLRTQAEQAMDQVVSELRNATRTNPASPPNATIPPPPNNDRIQFYLPTDVDGNGLIVDASGATEWDPANPIDYQYDAVIQQLQRIEAGASRVFANDVVAVTFQDQTIDPSLYADEVRVFLTLQTITPHQRTVSVTSSSVVKLRN